MKLINQSVEFHGQTPTNPKEIVKQLELVGRICYKSEDKITNESAPKFCQFGWDKGHFSIFDHSNIVINVPEQDATRFFKFLMPLHRRAAYHNFEEDSATNTWYINGNIRAWHETLTICFEHIGNHEVFNNIAKLLNQYLSQFFKFEVSLDNESQKVFNFKKYSVVTNMESIPLNLRQYTFKWITSRDVTHELVRHRPCAFLQESQRYVTYESGLTCILPTHFEGLIEGSYNKDSNDCNLLYFNNQATLWPEKKEETIWLDSLIEDEKNYKTIVKSSHNPEGWIPQYAREILPNAAKTEIIITADLPEWKHIFKMRASGAALPKIRRQAFKTATILNNEIPNYFDMSKYVE